MQINDKKYIIYKEYSDVYPQKYTVNTLKLVGFDLATLTKNNSKQTRMIFEKNKRPFRRAFISMVIGAGILTAVNLSSGITGVYIPVSMLSVLVSVIGGVPGVTLLLTLNMFF